MRIQLTQQLLFFLRRQLQRKLVVQDGVIHIRMQMHWRKLHAVFTGNTAVFCMKR